MGRKLDYVWPYGQDIHMDSEHEEKLLGSLKPKSDLL